MLLFGSCSQERVQEALGAHPLGQRREALFTNPEFETLDLQGWTTSTALNNGLAQYPVGSEGDLGLQAGGASRTSARYGTTEGVVPPGLSPMDAVRYPRFGLAAAVVNELGASKNVNQLGQSTTVTALDLDPADGRTHVRFALLPVMQNAGHAPAEQPYYFVSVVNETQAKVLYQRFNFGEQAGVPWVDSGSTGARYTRWLAFDLPLPRSAAALGDSLRATVTAAGCSQGGHWGEVIVDGFGARLPGLAALAIGPDSVEAGADFQYSYRISNGGAGSVSGVKLTSNLPAGTTFRSVDTSGISCTTPAVGAAGAVVCDVGALEAGEALVLKVAVRANADAPPLLVHGNYFVWGAAQPLVGMAVTTAVTTGGTTQYVDLATSIDDGKAELYWGQTAAQWTVTVRNRGPATATSARVATNAPAGLTGLSWTCVALDGGSCGAASGTGALDTTATLPVGAQVLYTLSAGVASGSGAGLVSLTAKADAPAGTAERFVLDNEATDDDALTAGAPPAITSPATAAGKVGVAFSYATTATGAAPLVLSATGLPAWATFDPGTGVVSGTPSAAGSFSFSLTATNPLGSDEQTVTLEVAAPPSVTSALTAAGAPGLPFAYAMTASGTGPVTLGATGLPAWASFEPSTGVISGTPLSVETVAIGLTATSAHGADSKTLWVTISELPVITSALTARAAVGQAFSYTLTAAGTSPVLGATGLPGWAGFAPGTGVLSGTPTSAGTHSIGLQASNTAGSDSRSLQLAVRPAIPAPDILQPAAGSAANSLTVQVSGVAPAAESGNSVEVREGSTVLCTAPVPAQGDWQCTAWFFSPGPHVVTARLVDSGGLVGPAADGRSFTIDLTPPAVPVWTAPAEGALLATAAPRLSGKGEPGARVAVDSASGLVCAATVDGAGDWACTPAADLAQGAVTLGATQTDAAGNASATAERVLHVDTTAPPAPTLAPVADARGLTLTRTPRFEGSAEAGATVTVSVDGTVVCSTAADSDGRWSCPSTAPLSDGAHAVVVTVADPAGNTTTLSVALTVQADSGTTGPPPVGTEPSLESPPAPPPESPRSAGCSQTGGSPLGTLVLLEASLLLWLGAQAGRRRAPARR